MRHTILNYDSKNGIRFHHTLSTYEKGEQDSVIAESHDLCEIFLLIQGRLTYSIDGKKYQPKPYDLVLVAPHELHSLKIDTSSAYERMVLRFSLDLLPSLKDIDLLSPFKQAKTISHLLPASLIQNTQIVPLFHHLKSIIPNKSTLTDYYIIRVIHDIMGELLTLPENAALLGQVGQPSIRTVHSISQKCMQYVNENLHKPLNAQSVAKALNLSASHLQNTFKQEIGITLHTYIITQKMHQAAHMINNGSTPQETADALGYTYYKTFYRNFCQINEYPPSWRPFYHQRRWVNDQSLDQTPEDK
jgi:AraC-like DNA-binding protein